MAKCLILGADGFLGSHLADSLLREGHSIKAFDRFPDSKPRNLRVMEKNLEIIQGDFLNKHDLETACNGVDYVFHLISTTNPASSSMDPLIDVETNIRMSVELFQICAEQKIRKLVFPSTGGAIYGRHNEDSFTEDDRADPISPYAIGKLTIEGYLRYFKQSHGLQYIIYRVSNPYGEKQNIVGSQGVIPIFLNLMKHDEPLPVFGDGSMVRDYVYVKDVADMITKTFSKKNKTPIYNLGSSQAVSVNDLINVLNKVTGLKAKIRRMPMRTTDVRKVVLNTDRFYEDFGLRASTKLEDGIFKTWKYISKV